MPRMLPLPGEETPTKHKRKSLPTSHVQFNSEDNERIKAKASMADMKVSTYLRHVGLHSVVPPPPPFFDVIPILNHTETLNDLVADVREIADRPHPDRWRYEADIEKIDDTLRLILQTELELIETIRKLNGR